MNHVWTGCVVLALCVCCAPEPSWQVVDSTQVSTAPLIAAQLHSGTAETILARAPTTLEDAALAVGEVANAPIVAVTQINGWLVFATVPSRSDDPQAIPVFIGGYALRLGEPEVLRWSVW